MDKRFGTAAVLLLLISGCAGEGTPATVQAAAEKGAPVPVGQAVRPPDAAGKMPAASPPGPRAGERQVNAAIDTLLGDHRKYQAVIEAYQAAVANGDRHRVGALVRYPLAVTIDNRKTSIDDAAAFVRQYDRIITPAIAGVITSQEYQDLMVNQQGVMFGRGETWVNGICRPESADCSDFEVKVIAIQPGGQG